MTWSIVVILAMTGQKLALKQPSEEACRADLERVDRGIYRAITLSNGVVLPITGALGCFTEDQLRQVLEWREGNGV